ncbi:MAG: hypothetical protein AABW63_02640 [Nanoarchaeota archaeon]
MLIKNKNGSVHVPLIVFMTVATVITAIFIFTISASNFEAKISDARVVQFTSNVYDFGEFYINQAGEKAFADSYFELINDKSFLENPKINSNGDLEFAKLNSNLNDEMLKKISPKFKENFNSYEFTNEFMVKIKESISTDRFRIVNENGKSQIAVTNLEFSFSSNNINVVYFPEISALLDTNKIGLDSFEEIYTAKEKCKNDEEIKECFEQELKSFNVDVGQKTDNGNRYYLVTLTSKQEFFIDGEFMSLKLSFVGV